MEKHGQKVPKAVEIACDEMEKLMIKTNPEVYRLLEIMHSKKSKKSE